MLCVVLTPGGGTESLCEAYGGRDRKVFVCGKINAVSFPFL